MGKVMRCDEMLELHREEMKCTSACATAAPPDACNRVEMHYSSTLAEFTMSIFVYVSLKMPSAGIYDALSIISIKPNGRTAYCAVVAHSQSVRMAFRNPFLPVQTKINFKIYEFPKK